MSDFTPRSSELSSIVIGGVAIIVIATLGFASISNDWLESSSAVQLNQERRIKVSDLEMQIAKLRAKVERHEEIFARRLAQDSTAENERQQQGKLQEELEIIMIEVADLELHATEQEAMIAKLGDQKSKHRDRARGGLWLKHQNQPLKASHLREPLPYRGPKILKIDAGGLTVRHESGVSRVTVAQLSPDFREELDLSVSEAKEAMTEMFLKDARIKSARGKQADAAAQAELPTPAEIEELLSKRLKEELAKVEKFHALIDSAEETAVMARRNSRQSSNKHPHGKLETWTERASRFEKAAISYREQLALAEAEVRRLTPGGSVPRLRSRAR